MQHRLKGLVLLVGLTFPFLAAGDASAQFNGALRGEYDISWTRACVTEAIEVNPGTGDFFSSNTGSILLQGLANFNGSGGGSFSGHQVQLFDSGSGPAGSGTPAGGGTEIILGRRWDVTCPTLTYTVNSDGTFTQQMNCSLTLTAPPAFVGVTSTLDQTIIRGKLALDGTSLALSDSTNLNIETFSVTSGPNTGFVQRRICTGSGLATSRR